MKMRIPPPSDLWFRSCFFSLGERFVFVKKTSVKSGMLWVWCALEAEEDEEEPRNEVRL